MSDADLPADGKIVVVGDAASAFAYPPAALARCLPLYRAWGLADRGIIAAIDRLLAELTVEW